ncbi:Serine/threonine protein kinase [Planctomycetales bacterium 10988]|nr:Serine/threonine protein kinase [Planctomycetales bacterium 10988]
MNVSSSGIDEKTFIELAKRYGLMDDETAQKLIIESEITGLSVSQLALEKGVLDYLGEDIIHVMSQAETLLPDYEILELLGRGGMGVVYRATQKKLDRPVALKMILAHRLQQAGALARFEREAKMVAKMRHPNIVAAYDFGRQGTRYYLAMELLEGEPLDNFLAKRGALDETLTWTIVRQVACGLAHAAEQGIIHRDIKPSNLILVRQSESATSDLEGLVKITDFGLARPEDVMSDLTLTQSGVVMGTPLYMAPEQFLEGKSGQLSDIYSLGATAYQMLSGFPPFNGRSFAEIAIGKDSGKLAHWEKVAPRLTDPTKDLLKAMLSSRIERRPQDYPELIQWISHILEGKSPVILNMGKEGNLKPGAPLNSDTPTQEIVGETLLFKSKPSLSNWQLFSLATLLFISLGLGFFFISRSSLSDTPSNQIEPSTIPEEQAPLIPASLQILTKDVPPPTLAQVEQAKPLYDGQSLTGISPLSGEWFTNMGPEGGIVLSGAGKANISLPNWSFYTLSILIYPEDCRLVDLCFGCPDADNPGSRYVIRYQQNTLQAGLRGKEESDFQPICEPVELKDRDPEEKKPFSVQISRQPEAWWIMHDEEQLFGINAIHGENEEFFQMDVKKGPAYFEAFYIEKLAEKALTP